MWSTLARLPVDERVAVGMGVLDMDDLDVVAVEVEGEVVAERHHRQRPGRATAATMLGADELLHRHAAPDIVVGDDDGAGAAEFSFPPVWSPCQWVLTTKRTGSGSTVRDRGEDPVGQRRELVVDR